MYECLYSSTMLQQHFDNFAGVESVVRGDDDEGDGWAMDTVGEMRGDAACRSVPGKHETAGALLTIRMMPIMHGKSERTWCVPGDYTGAFAPRTGRLLARRD